MGRKLIEHPFYTIIYGSFVLFIILPFVYTLGATFFDGSSLADNFLLLNKDIFLLLAKSCVIAFSIAILSTIFGSSLGFLLYKTNFPFRSFFKIALLIPLFISPYILAVAWKDFFFILFNSADLISSGIGVVLVLSFIYTPLSMIITGSGLSNINSHLEEMGLLTTGLRGVIFKIMLPLMKPALFSSFVLVFIFSISNFSVPAFFGFKLFTTEIFIQFSAFYNHALAILQSAFLVVICLLLLYADRKHLADAPFLSIGGKGTSIRKYSLGKGLWLGWLGASFWLLVSVVFPFIILFIQSFKGGTEKFIQAFDLLKSTFSDSILLAFSGATITTIVGFTAAYFSETKGKNFFNWLLLFVFAIPSIIFGISLIKFYNHPGLDMIYAGYAIILIGYTGKFSFISAKLTANAIKQIPYSLEEAAQIEGVGFYRRLQTIIFPLIMPALFASVVINFIFCLGELGTTIMVYPPGTEIMPIKVFTIMANAPQSLVSSMSLIVFSVTLVVITSLAYIGKKFIRSN